jgi:vacuolar-type H+-ATPase subunit H
MPGTDSGSIEGPGGTIAKKEDLPEQVRGHVVVERASWSLGSDTMEESASLLEQVSQKEIALKAEYEAASQKAQETIEQARRNADDMVREADREGLLMASEYYKKEMASAEAEAEQIRRRGEEAVRTTRETGGKRLPLAVEGIIRSVSVE